MERIFFSHTLAEGRDGRAAEWATRYRETHPDSTVTLGSADYARCQESMTRQQIREEWAPTRAFDTLPRGQDRYTGCVIPGTTESIAGRYGADIVQGFITAGKPVLLWDPETGDEHVVTGLEVRRDPDTGTVSYQEYANYVTEEAE